MAVEWNKFWCRVLFKEFIRHFRKLSNEEIVDDIRQSMDDLEEMVADTGTFGSKMVKWANERADEPFATAARENGKKGGRPRKENNYGDAGSRKAPESIDNADGSASPGSTTVPKNVSTPAISTNGRRTGGPSLSQTSIPPVRQAEPDVLSLAYSGEFQNVLLSQAQYNELGIRFGNLAKLNRAIDSLSCKIENGETNPRNHYAELVKWANYRDDMDEAEEVKAAKQPHYETVSEHNARIVAEGKKWIDEHFPKKDNKNG